jgi:CO/xanthine dehydrogenase FAD-binding subunit
LGRSLYLQPARVQDALAALAARPLSVLAGGTDFYPARIHGPVHEDILDISRLTVLRQVSQSPSGWRIGALTTWSDVLHEPLPPLFDGLKLAAREIGGMQIQNAGTVGGNLCNASPAADGIPALMALSAEVELASVRGARRVPLTEFVKGKAATLRQPDELLTAVLVPAHGAQARSTFLKLGARRYLVISAVMVAVTLDVDGSDRVTGAGVAVGSCAPAARRLPTLEHKLADRVLASDLSDAVDARDLAVLSPISDVRASAEYRLDAAHTLLKRALRGLSDV